MSEISIFVWQKQHRMTKSHFFAVVNQTLTLLVQKEMWFWVFMSLLTDSLLERSNTLDTLYPQSLPLAITTLLISHIQKRHAQITAKLTPQILDKCRCMQAAGRDLRCDALASTLLSKWLISHFDFMAMAVQKKLIYVGKIQKPRGPRLVTSSLNHANCSMQMIPTDTVFTAVSQYAESIWLKQQMRILIHTPNN